MKVDQTKIYQNNNLKCEKCSNQGHENMIQNNNNQNPLESGNKKGRGGKRNQGGRVNQVTYVNQLPPGYVPTPEEDEDQGF